MSASETDEVVRLDVITDLNRDAMLALRVAPTQEGFVSTVRDSLAEAAQTHTPSRGIAPSTPVMHRSGSSC